MKNKGFTLVELLGTIVIIGIIFAIAIPSVTYIIRASKKRAYRAHENTMKKAATAYLTDNSAKIPAKGEKCFINVDTLVAEKYIDSLSDPEDKARNCHEGSYVNVYRSNEDINISLTYEPYLNCSKNIKPEIEKVPGECQ